MTPATAASRPPALIARSAAELADELSLLEELLEELEVAVLVDSESSVAVAEAEPVDDVLAALPVDEAVLVVAYWLARLQYWVTWFWVLGARMSSGQLL